MINANGCTGFDDDIVCGGFGEVDALAVFAVAIGKGGGGDFDISLIGFEGEATSDGEHRIECDTLGNGVASCVADCAANESAAFCQEGSEDGIVDMVAFYVICRAIGDLLDVAVGRWGEKVLDLGVGKEVDGVAVFEFAIKFAFDDET